VIPVTLLEVGEVIQNFKKLNMDATCLIYHKGESASAWW
jgi:hypothetical protein